MRIINVLLISLSCVLSNAAMAGLNLADVEHWNNIGNQSQTYAYFSEVNDQLIAEKGDNAVIWQSAGTSCPAGHFYLVNKARKTYQAIDSGACEDENVVIKLEKNNVKFTSNGKITAVYPIY